MPLPLIPKLASVRLNPIYNHLCVEPRERHQDRPRP